MDGKSNLFTIIRDMEDCLIRSLDSATVSDEAVKELKHPDWMTTGGLYDVNNEFLETKKMLLDAPTELDDELVAMIKASETSSVTEKQ